MKIDCKNMDPFYRDILNSNYIYAAIDTYDMAKVVRAATTAHGSGSMRMKLVEAKSKTASADSRSIGNKHYKAGRIRLAVEYYNKALAFAPNHSEEMILAYGNRSAVFFSIRYFSACLRDIGICLAMQCSEALATKLKKRRDEATPFMFEELAIQMMSNSEFVNSYLRFDCKRNRDVPCASADVAFVTRDGSKRVTAGGEIRPGAVVAIERAFVTCPTENSFFYLSCYYCNKADLCLYPCEGCCKALFCKNECRIQCMKEYHNIECKIISYLGSLYTDQVNVLMTRAAIKLSLRMGWDAFITASKDIGASRMRTATVKQTFNSKEPLSILSYDDDKHFMEGRMYNGGIACAYILRCLLDRNIENYFPKGTEQLEAAIDAMARVMLHLYVTFTNKIFILSSAYDFSSTCFKNCMQCYSGWFSMTSKLGHSCEPNLLVLGLNDSVALVALRTIKRGEELTISYNGYLYDRSLQRTNRLDRMTQLFLETRHTCDCWICRKNWDRNSAVTVEMTKKQSKLFTKLNEKAFEMYDYACFTSICEALDTFPVNAVQHRLAFDALQWMLNLIQSKYSNNVTHI